MRIKDQEPTIFLKLTDNWIEMKGRYMTASRERNSMRSKITQQVLERIEKSGNIDVASQTLDIIGFPEPRTALSKSRQIPERINELSS
jgi:hypothetical protein